MTEINIKIRTLTPAEREKQDKEKTLVIEIIAGEKACETCNERMKCITDKQKCLLYNLNGTKGYGTRNTTLGEIVRWIKEKSGEL